jgi:hypothetical protein
MKRIPSEPFNADSSLIPTPSRRARFQNIKPAKCACRSETTTPIDLGFGFNPRYFSQVTCNESSCGSPHYRCVPVNYTVFPLRSTSSVEEAVPHSVNSNWEFERVNVTVACVCRRIYPQD